MFERMKRLVIWLIRIAGIWVDSRAFSNLAAAVTAIGSESCTLYVARSETIDSDLMIPANITLKFKWEAILTVSAGVTLTINGEIGAGLWQIFDGAGIVVLNGVKRVYPEWWGAIPDDTPIQKAIDSLANGGVVFFSGGTYRVAATLNLTSSDNVRLIGNDWNTTISFENISVPGILIQRQGCAVMNLELAAPRGYAVPLIRIHDVGREGRRTGALIERVKFSGQDYTPGSAGVEIGGDGSFGTPWNMVRECYFYMLEKQIKIGPSRSWLNGNSFISNIFDLPRYAVYMERIPLFSMEISSPLDWVADLNEGRLPADLQARFDPPLPSDARIEAREKDIEWRIYIAGEGRYVLITAENVLTVYDLSLGQTNGNTFMGNHVQASVAGIAFEVGFRIEGSINTFMDNHVWDIPAGKLAFHIQRTANRTIWLGGGSILPAVFKDDGTFSQVLTPYTVGISEWIKVGLGTYEPEANIHIKAEHPEIKLEDTIGAGYQAVIDASGGYAEPVAIRGRNDYPLLKMLAGGTQTALYANNEERMRISANGNIGIGTPPGDDYKLDVAGNIQATAFDVGDITFRNQQTRQIHWRMFEDEDGLYLENPKTGKVYSFVLKEVDQQPKDFWTFPIEDQGKPLRS